MKKYLMLVSLMGLLFLSGCISQQQVSPAKRVADDSEKITMFDFMETRWAYMSNDWVTGEKVTPYLLMEIFHIPREQATNELKEFENIHRNFNWFQRFFTFIDLSGVRYYINPPQ